MFDHQHRSEHKYQATADAAHRVSNSKDVTRGEEGQLPASVGEGAEHAVAARVDGHPVRHLLLGLHLDHLPTTTTTTKQQISTGYSAPRRTGAGSGGGRDRSPPRGRGPPLPPPGPARPRRACWARRSGPPRRRRRARPSGAVERRGRRPRPRRRRAGRV